MLRNILPRMEVKAPPVYRNGDYHALSCVCRRSRRAVVLAVRSVNQGATINNASAKSAIATHRILKLSAGGKLLLIGLAGIGKFAVHARHQQIGEFCAEGFRTFTGRIA